MLSGTSRGAKFGGESLICKRRLTFGGFSCPPHPTYRRPVRRYVAVMGQGPSSQANLPDVNNDSSSSALSNVAFPARSPSTAPTPLKENVLACLADQGADAGIDSPVNGQSGPPVDLVPSVFTWSYGGENVYITGSFNQWKCKIPMQRSTVDFSVIIEVPPGVVQYKFIVDDEWRFAPDQPTVMDPQGVVNNLVEIVPPQDTEAVFDSDDGEVNVAYGQTEPSTNEYTKEPPPLPPHLGIILLNSEDTPGQNDAVILPVPQHVTLNHIYASKSDSKDVCVLGMTQRYKSKFVTTVYYRPNPTINANGVIASREATPMAVS